MRRREHPANHGRRVNELRTRGPGYSGHGRSGNVGRSFVGEGSKRKETSVTTDKGFVNYRRESHFGILVVRLHQPNERKIHERVMTAIGQFAEKDWNGLLVVMRDVVQSTWRQA